MATDENALQHLRIAPMTMQDVKQVHHIECISFPTPWDLDSYYAEVENPAARYLVAHLDDHVAGFVGMWIVADEAHIVTLAVDPACRNRGIGRELLKRILDDARHRNVATITLEVRVGNAPAKKLYAAFGFHTIAYRRRYYPDNNEDAEVMKLSLHE